MLDCNWSELQVAGGSYFLYVLCPPVTSVLTQIQTCQVRMQALVPDTRQHLQRSYGVHASSGIKENIKIFNTCTK